MGNENSKPRSRLARVIDNLQKGMALAWDASPGSLINYSLLSITNAILSPAIVLLGSILINQIIEARLNTGSIKSMFPVLFGLWIAIVTQRAFGAFMVYGRNIFVRRVQLEAEQRLLTQAAKVDIGQFDNPDWHDKLARAKRDISWRPGDLVWSILSLSGNVVTILLMIALLASLHYALVLLAIVAAMLSLLLESKMTSKIYNFFYKEIPEEREREYLGDLLIQPKNTKEVRANVLADYLLERIRKLSESLFAQRAKMFKSGTKIWLLSGAVTGTTLTLAYVFVAINGARGTIDPGAIVLVIGAFGSVSSTLIAISATFVSVDLHTSFLDDYFSFLAAESVIRTPVNPKELPETLSKGIEFHNVKFTYPNAPAPAVVDMNLHIRPGELVAVVGENGAGKSTFVKLLLRFYDADEGSIKIGGIDLKELDPSALRSRIGVLFQDFVSYELSVRENVMMGRPDRPCNDEQIVEALYDSKSDWILKKMPQGLDSKVGHLFEGGHDLSGGEWQRLALARIIYRNADIWILDEPTSSVDPEAEAAIFAELKENLKGRIGIVISHRFSTVRIADRIAVFDNGGITELGSHEELLSIQGRYAQLFELQAKGIGEINFGEISP